MIINIFSNKVKEGAMTNLSEVNRRGESCRALKVEGS